MAAARSPSADEPPRDASAQAPPHEVPPPGRVPDVERGPLPEAARLARLRELEAPKCGCCKPKLRRVDQARGMRAKDVEVHLVLGADVDARVPFVSAAGKRALKILAVSAGILLVVGVGLLAAGVATESETDNVTMTTRGAILLAVGAADAVVVVLANRRAREYGDHGATLLFWAAEFGDAATVRMLLDNGADAKWKHPVTGRTPLDAALEASSARRCCDCRRPSRAVVDALSEGRAERAVDCARSVAGSALDMAQHAAASLAEVAHALSA